MDLVFFGSGSFGVPSLEALARKHRVRGVVSQPDRPAGRGGRLTTTPVAAWAEMNLPGVPLLKPATCNAAEVREEIRGWCEGPECAWVVIAFGQKLGRALLEGRFAVNLHASLLPRWRGAAPINAAVMAGDAATGNSVITLAERMDAGLVLGQRRREIGETETAGELHDALAAEGPGLLEEVLAKHPDGRGGLAQDERLVTLAPKLSREDGWVDFGAPAAACRARINGLNPWPGVVVGFRGERLKVLRAGTTLEEGDARAMAGGGGEGVGTVLEAGLGLVRCGEGTTLKVLEVQPANRRPMAWRDFANGHRVRSGEVLAGGREGC